jgi:hypothetical protein
MMIFKTLLDAPLGLSNFNGVDDLSILGFIMECKPRACSLIFAKKKFNGFKEK